MIKLFRNIRKNLINDEPSEALAKGGGKTSKYLKYAIGEIILVVIGILIALQINNWNEQRKTKQKETIILNEFLASINSDFTAYKTQNDPKLQRKSNGIDSLMTYIFDKREIKDADFISFYTNMKQDIFLRFDNGPFEDLKSSGLDIISNDSLRTAINNTYTVKLPIAQRFADNQDKDSNPEIYKLEPKFLKLIPFLDNNGKKYLQFNLKTEDILNNQDFLQVLALERNKYETYKYQLNRIRTILNELKTKIEKELKS